MNAENEFQSPNSVFRTSNKALLCVAKGEVQWFGNNDDWQFELDDHSGLFHP